LITGGRGYIATNLVRLLSAYSCHVLRLDRSGTSLPAISGAASIEDIIGDIRDGSVWETLLPKVDIVFHFAAQTSVYWANDHVEDDWQINVQPMLTLLQTCQRLGRNPVILFSGTVTQAGLPRSIPMDENHPDAPITVYDLHKLMAEEYLEYYTRIGVVRGTCLRLANVYGPGPRSSSADRGVLNAMVQKALRGETLTVYGEGEFIRDYLYVKDVARAFLAAARHIEGVVGRHWVIGSGEGHTIAAAIRQVAAQVAAHTGTQVPVVHVDPPASLSLIENRNFVADSRGFSQATGWHPKLTLSEGLEATVEAILATKGDRL
jgi:nucleoside-diphosphate-sugar epimerase